MQGKENYMDCEKYKDYPKHITFNGLLFYRDDKFGYYRHSFSKGKGKPLFLHRYVWEINNGAIPYGFEVHHKDGNKSNNAISNLELLKRGEHQKLHGKTPSDLQKACREFFKSPEFRIKSIGWHKSDEGHEWHRKHALEIIAAGKAFGSFKTSLICKQCKNSFYGDSRSEFCSGACKAKWRRDHHLDDIDVECDECHMIFRRSRFRVKEGKKNFCSRACAGKDRSRLMIGNVNGIRRNT